MFKDEDNGFILKLFSLQKNSSKIAIRVSQRFDPDQAWPGSKLFVEVIDRRQIKNEIINKHICHFYPPLLYRGYTLLHNSAITLTSLHRTETGLVHVCKSLL